MIIPTTQMLCSQAESVGWWLHTQGMCVATAESCTGGLVAKLLTDTSGSSAWFERGFVTYSNASKQEILGVSSALLMRQGAVSEAVVRAMAEGALLHSRADISLAITGIAGPEGGSHEKPVGTVWFAWAGRLLPTRSLLVQFSGSREQIRMQAAQTALDGIYSIPEKRIV